MNKKLVFLVVTIALMMSSCASRKNFVYLNDMNLGKEYASANMPEAKIQVNDRLDVTVACKNPELAVPFNTRSGGYQVKADGDVTAVEATASEQQKGYRVDKDGNIGFPIFGSIHVEGLTLAQVSDTIRQKIIEGKYMQNPSVTAEFLNFKIYMLGEVGHTGPISADGERINLLEAISLAGDLTAKARTDRVMVLRTVNNSRQIYVNDIRSSKMLQSPTFYLQQNDVVYVEPKYRNSSKEDVGFKYASFLLSAASVLSWVFYYLK
jgi:polysaccharide export outer membrane protein